jgi:translocation and assembly module TamA
VRKVRLAARIAAIVAGVAILAAQAVAAPVLSFDIASEDEGLTGQLRAASLTATALSEGQTDPADVISAALADYRGIVETLYANGYYSGIVSIRADGREVADMALLSLPAQIGQITITVDPGRPFRFGTVSVSPLAPGETPPEALQSGAPARATILGEATAEVIREWREDGHAKAAPGAQAITANHAQGILNADIRVIPGPRLRFGALTLDSPSAVRQERLRRIAGFPSGEVFSPQQAERVAARLRRTGAFSSVSLEEGPAKADGTMDIGLTVVDRKPRRYGFGAELSSREGLDLSVFWLHRNLFGGAERFRIEGEISQIGAQNDDPDYRLGLRLDRPAIFGPDTSQFFIFELEHEDEPLFISDRVELGAGFTWYMREDIETEFAITYLRSDTRSVVGDFNYHLLTFPARFTRDRRNDPLDATDGTYVRLEATPYLGLSGSESGARLYADARGYQALGAGRTVLAARFQLGAIFGSSQRETYPDYLFFSGGGGTVRGQPYQSLGVEIAPGVIFGGRSFFGTQLELRTGITDTIGAVVFADAGYLGSGSFFDGAGDWHAGAGIGLRYDTGIGPIRLDLAAPVSGDTGDGAQIYIGIGQAF